MMLAELLFHRRLTSEKLNWFEIRTTILDFVLAWGLNLIIILLSLNVIFKQIVQQAQAGKYFELWNSANANQILVFIFVFIGVDFVYFLSHLLLHKINLFWITHAAHHSVKQFNMFNAIRKGPLIKLFGAGSMYLLFFLIFSFEFKVIAMCVAINKFWQIFTHNTWVPSMGFLENFLITPVHHRVHHSSDQEHFNCNYGGMFNFFDRIFGTFMDGRNTTTHQYGLKNYEGCNELTTLFHEWPAYFSLILRKTHRFIQLYLIKSDK